MPERRQRKRLVVGDRRRAGIAVDGRYRRRPQRRPQSPRAGRRRARSRHWPRRPPPCRAARRPARRRRCRRAISAGRDGRRSARPPGSSRRRRPAHRPRSRRARCRRARPRSCARRPCRRRRRSTEPLSTGKPAFDASARCAAETSGRASMTAAICKPGGERRLDRAPAILIVGEQRDAPCRRRGDSARHRCAPPTPSSRPGVSLPANTIGRSMAPAATTQRLATIRHSRWRT